MNADALGFVISFELVKLLLRFVAAASEGIPLSDGLMIGAANWEHLPCIYKYGIF